MMAVRSKIVIIAACLFSIIAFFAYQSYNYARQPAYKTFKSNITFQYPKSWTVKSGCDFKGAFIGTRTIVRGDFKASKDAKLVLHGYIAERGKCVNGNQEVKINQQQESCTNRKSDKILKNGMRIDLNQLGRVDFDHSNADINRVSGIGISTECGARLFSFDFVKNTGEGVELNDDLLKYREPGVNKDKFVKSDAYADIVEFAESIKIEK